MNTETIELIKACAPVIASAITVAGVVWVGWRQGQSTLLASQKQSDATIKAVHDTINAQSNARSQEQKENALADLMTILYLLEINHSHFGGTSGERDVFKIIARVQVVLGRSKKEVLIINLLKKFSDDLLHHNPSTAGDIRNEIEKAIAQLL